MVGRCVKATGASLGVPERGNFYGPKTVFNIEVNREYRILGMGIFDTVLLVLVCDESRKPNWLPIGLFEFDSWQLPASWEFSLLDGVAASGGASSDRWVARWGYAELVQNAHHSDALIERDPEALKVFFRELRKLDEEQL